MSAFKLGTITIIVNGYTLNNGLPYFQKSVPAMLRDRLGKSSIKIPLRAENGHVALQCHRLSKKYEALFKAMKTDDSLSDSDTKVAALALLDHFNLRQGDGSIENEMPLGWEGTWDPTPHVNEFLDDLGTSAVEQLAFRALNNPLPTLLSEAFSVYLANHQKGTDQKFRNDQIQHWDKLVALLGDIALESLTRDHARQYRDHRLATGVKTTSVKREINVIKAVINVAIREIPLNIRNHFDSLTIQNCEADAVKRNPYNRDELRKLVDAALIVNDERRRIVLVLAFTGARLAEIVGLRRQDVDLDTGVIHITPHSTRTLKTPASTRSLPLLPIALRAIQQQLSDTNDEYIFPSYANKLRTKTDSASATLNKWSKSIIPGKTMHCLRHTLRDQLRAVMCPESVSKEIGGWISTNDVSVGYGQGYPIALKREWLAKAYLWLN